MTTAKCCWCGDPFVFLGKAYWCNRWSCRERQAARGIAIQNTSTGEWRYLFVPLPRQACVEEIASTVIRGGRSHKILLGGAAGPGKSYAGRHILYRRCLTIPNFEALILRESFPELKRSHMRRMTEEEPVFRQFGVAAEFIPTNFVFKFPNGSIIELGHMDDAQAIRKYRSAEYDGILLDEAVQYQPDALLEIVSRARTTKPAVRAAGGPLVLFATNPGGPAAGLLRSLCIDKRPDLRTFPQLEHLYYPDEWDYIPANLEDNPYLDEHYEADLAINQPWRFQQLRYNNWDIVAGQFFSEFEAQPSTPDHWSHVADLGDPGESVEWFRSLDWGYVNPGCCLWWACLPDGILYVRRAWRFDHLPVDDVARRILEMTRDMGIGPQSVRYTVADPSVKGQRGTHGETIGETFTRAGLTLLYGDNDRIMGWQRVRQLLCRREDGRPHVVFHPIDAGYLIRTFAEAVSSKRDPDDVDTTGDDHGLDAFRYGAMSRPSPTILRTHPPARSFARAQARAQEYRRSLTIR